MTAVIELHQVSKRFGSVLAVDGLSFSVDAGQVCGLLGPNGAGKTTSLRMLVGLVYPSSGDLGLLGTPVRPGGAALARTGTMIEHAAFVPYLSGMTNLRLYWEAGGSKFSDAAVEDALAIADLGDAVNRKVKTYSQGMRQRLGIARALLGRPEVLVLDEPTNGLDPGEMREVRQLLRRFAETGSTVLLSSHLLSEIEQVCSHAVVMDHGRLVTSGTVRDLTAAVGTAYLEVDGDVAAARSVLEAVPGVGPITDESPGLTVELGTARRADLVAALVHGGIDVETVVSRRRLEDAFLGLLNEEA